MADEKQVPKKRARTKTHRRQYSKRWWKLPLSLCNPGGTNGAGRLSGGIVALAVIFRFGDGDPVQRVHRTPMCRVTCTVRSTLEAPLGTVVCTSKTELAWNDFVEREVARDPHSYCGACGTPVPCERVKLK